MDFFLLKLIFLKDKVMIFYEWIYPFTHEICMLKIHYFIVLTALSDSYWWVCTCVCACVRVWRAYQVAVVPRLYILVWHYREKIKYPKSYLVLTLYIRWNNRLMCHPKHFYTKSKTLHYPFWTFKYIPHWSLLMN